MRVTEQACRFKYIEIMRRRGKRGKERWIGLRSRSGDRLADAIKMLYLEKPGQR